MLQSLNNKTSLKKNSDLLSSLFFLCLTFNSGVLSAAPLNDTGITQCADETTNGLACPQATHPGQDAEYGRDVTHNDNSDGHAGFSFTKLDANGNALAASAASWFCVQDNVTGLIWEAKTDDGGLRDKDWYYTWYNSSGINDGGSAGTANGGSCYDSSHCDTEKYVQQVNSQGLCGHNDWRMPTKNELVGLVSFDRNVPAIDTDYFALTAALYTGYWSASSSANGQYAAFSVGFIYGYSGSINKGSSNYVRLVRARQ